MSNPFVARKRQTVSPSEIQPDGWPNVLPFDQDAWPGESLGEKVKAYVKAAALGRDRPKLAEATLATYRRLHGYGRDRPIPASVPPFEPTSNERLRVTLDAYAWVRRHGLALDFHAVAREWLAEHGDEFEPGDAPASERERFGY